MFIIAATVKLTLVFKGVYYFDIEYLKIVENSGFTEEEIKKNYDYLIEYLTSNNEEEFHLPTIKYSETGKIHFEDVKKIFIFIDKLFYITGVVSLVGMYLYNKRKDYRYLSLTSNTLIVLPVALGASFAINFDFMFELFHKIAFSNDYWIFDHKTDPVIKILPQDYFMHEAIFILIIVGVVCIGMKLVYKNIKIYEKWESENYNIRV